MWDAARKSIWDGARVALVVMNLLSRAAFHAALDTVKPPISLCSTTGSSVVNVKSALRVAASPSELPTFNNCLACVLLRKTPLVSVL